MKVVNPALIEDWIEQIETLFENLSDVDCPHIENSEKERAEVNRQLLSLRNRMIHFRNGLDAPTYSPRKLKEVTHPYLERSK